MATPPGAVAVRTPGRGSATVARALAAALAIASVVLAAALAVADPVAVESAEGGAAGVASAPSVLAVGGAVSAAL
ncbi:MAG: hypothetical protein HY908_36360 [Myxococcales bacterium]|nr:hypothetical protein [Myxococcales bacterium]